MTQTVMGVDYGTMRTAMVVLGPSEPRVWVDRYGKDWTQAQALADAHYRLAAFARAFSPWVIAIESPIVGASKNAQTAVKMSMMAGALAAAAGKGSSAVVLVPPSTWKRQVVGHGNASKSDVAKWLCENHPGLYTECTKPESGKVDQDLVDATCIALSAQRGLAT